MAQTQLAAVPTYAGFGVRLAAHLVDTALLALVLVLGAVYGSGLLDRSATPGKMAFELRIVDAATLERLTTRAAVLRYAGYLVSLLPLGTGVFAILRSPTPQGWHDRLAGRAVVRSAPAVQGLGAA